MKKTKKLNERGTLQSTLLISIVFYCWYFLRIVSKCRVFNREIIFFSVLFRAALDLCCRHPHFFPSYSTINSLLRHRRHQWKASGQSSRASSTSARSQCRLQDDHINQTLNQLSSLAQWTEMPVSPQSWAASFRVQSFTRILPNRTLVPTRDVT